MDWKIPNDKTDAVITAQKNIASSHGNSSVPQLPETCIIFEIGMVIPFIEEHFSTYTITQHIPGFITDQKCIGVEPPRKGCFFVGKGKRIRTHLNGTVRRSSVVQGNPYKLNCRGMAEKISIIIMLPLPSLNKFSIINRNKCWIRVGCHPDAAKAL